jgi:hypothetical protein
LEVNLRKYRLLAFLGLIILFLYFPQQTSFASQRNKSINIINPTVEYTFGEQFIFKAEIIGNVSINNVELVINPNGINNSIVIPVTVDTFNKLETSYIIKPQDVILPFSTIKYQYTITLNTGTQVSSDTFSFVYSDNRFDWQHLEEENLFSVHWYEGDLSFGRAIFDASANSIDRYKKYLILPNPQNLDIYVYANPSELQEILDISAYPWVAGHAIPENDLVFVSITPGALQLLDIERQIPHEIAHVRIKQYLEDGYENLPVWFNEGLASLAETFPNSDYKLILTKGYEKHIIISFSSLCRNFPADSSDINMAYAQSDSFVRYIYQEYGANGLQNLLDAYKQGHSCEKGPSEAFGVSLTQLEKQWHIETFGSPPPISMYEIIAWALLVLVIFITPVTSILLSNRRNS